MKKVTKILSKTVDALKETALFLFHENEEEVLVDVWVEDWETAVEATSQLLDLVFDPKNPGKQLKPLTIEEYRIQTEKWLTILVDGISETLKFRLKEELSKAIHEDMESLWMKIENVEERVKELELKA